MHSHILEEYYAEYTGLDFDYEFQNLRESGANAFHDLISKIQKHNSAPVVKEIVGTHILILRLFKETGEKAFLLTENISQLLYNTDVSSITCNMLNLPYKCIYLEFPKGMRPKGLEGEKIVGAYIYLSEKENKGLSVIFVQTTKNKAHSPINQLSILSYEFDKNTDVCRKIHETNSELKIVKFYGKDLLNNLMDIILNTILYITMEDADVIYKKRPKSQKAPKKKKKGRTPVEHFIIGGNIVIDKTIPKIAYLGESLSKEQVQRTHCWFVRGHWRNQPYGSGIAPIFRTRS